MHLKDQLADITKHISLKDTTCAGDIVLVGSPQGFFYAVVHDIGPDGKKNWYAVHFTALVLPPVDTIWKLREPQMCGEIFTINGEEHFMQAVELGSGCQPDRDLTGTGSTRPENSGNIVPFRPKK